MFLIQKHIKENHEKEEYQLHRIIYEGTELLKIKQQNSPYLSVKEFFKEEVAGMHGLESNMIEIWAHMIERIRLE